MIGKILKICGFFVNFDGFILSFRIPVGANVLSFIQWDKNNPFLEQFSNRVVSSVHPNGSPP